MQKQERRIMIGRVCTRKNERGSVMMEYVVVTFFVAAAIVFLWHGIYNFETASVNDKSTTYYSPSSNSLENSTAPLGQEILNFFQRLTSGIALPIP